MGKKGGVLGQAILPSFARTAPADLEKWMVGTAANLALFGEIQSWLSPEATPRLSARAGHEASAALRLAEMSWKNSEFDVGVEWPEFRSVDRVVIRFADAKSSPNRGRQFVEFWDGLTSRQGTWRTLEDNTLLGVPLEIEGSTWTFRFSLRRTCKVRLRLQEQKQVEIASFEVYGPSKWKSGAVHIEWGHLQKEQTYDGSLSVYNGVVLEVHPISGAEVKEGWTWTSTAGSGKIAGIMAKVLYTSGADVDRTIATVRTRAFDFSFLPGEAIESQPIDIPEYGVYVRNADLNLDRDACRKSNSGKSRIIDAVRNHSEQTLANAYQSIRVMRVTLSFVGVDSNSQKFGIAPDGHMVVANNDPSCGQPVYAKFAVHFASEEAPTLFQDPAIEPEKLFFHEEEKHQELEEGWLPIVVTRWSRNEVSFERYDYATMAQPSEPFDESKALGNELALLISRLKILNNSTVPKTVSYYIKPWKPADGGLDYGPIRENQKGAWEAKSDGSFLLVDEDGRDNAICFVETHGRGALSLSSPMGALRYSLKLNPGEEQVIHLTIPGRPLPAQERDKLRDLPHDQLHESVVQYWKDRLKEGMQIEVPDQHLQNIYNASLHHFLLALTKDGKRGEHYPNAAMVAYGSIGSESSPVIQSLDMRGLHGRAESCLQAWLSTQGDSMPTGDYLSKEGGFYHFWPNYTIDQGAVLWALAEHYLYTQDKGWLTNVAPQIIAGCDFIIRERKRTMKDLPGGRRPLYYGLAPAGCVADPRDWEYSFMLNAYFYLGLKKSAQVLRAVNEAEAQRISAEAGDYRQTIRRVLKECIAVAPVTRLRDGTSVPSVPSYVGLRGLSTDVKDSVDPDPRHCYGYDSTIGPFHLLKGQVLDPQDPEVSWMLNYLEDRFFMFTPLESRVELDDLSRDWFNLGGFEKLQPYYVHYQDAYLQRDQIPNFLRGFFNTLASISDPMTLTFQEELDRTGAQPHKTHEESWFFHQLRFMLVMEMGDSIFLARGTPREWLADGKEIAVSRAPSYFGEIGYRIKSRVDQGRIEATVQPPARQRPSNLFLRIRHPARALLKRVTVDGRPWQDFDSAKEWIKLPTESDLRVIAYYS
jgi:hypothetical protein